MKRFLMLSGLWAIGYGTRVMAADASSAPGVPPAAEPPASHQPESYMRVRSPEAGVRIIETATRTFHPANGPGPDIRLVGVTHIGEAAYYTAIQQTLDTSTLVLFEGVGRPDFVTQSPDTPEDRAAWTAMACTVPMETASAST